MTTTPLRSAWEALPSYRLTAPAHGYPDNIQHLFAPVDRVHEALVALCAAATTSLVCSMYGWDDDEVDQLFRAKLADEHVFVALSLDSSQAGGVHEREILKRWKADEFANSVAIGRSSKGAINHDKMIVIDGVVTVAGSTNLSAGGEGKQNNEMVIVWDAVFAAEARARIDKIHDAMLSQMARAKASG